MTPKAATTLAVSFIRFNSNFADGDVKLHFQIILVFAFFILTVFGGENDVTKTDDDDGITKKLISKQM